MNKQKEKRIVYAFLFLCLVVVSLAVIYLEYDSKQNKDNYDNEKPQEEENKEVSTLNMLLVGDALIHANVFNDVKVNNTYDFSPIFANVKDIIGGYDLAFYNQETIIGGKELGYSGYPTFNSPTEIGDTMINMGFNLVSLANNHTMDKGEQGVINSLNYWKNKDVLTAGSYSSIDERNEIRIKEKNGIKYSLLAYTLITNLSVPSSRSYLLNIYDQNKVKEDIQRIRDQVDLLIVSMHWGDEYSLVPNTKQKEIAAFLSSLGVDIVIGTHTHSVQPIEYINGTLVFYSLGNFISSQLDDNNLIGLMPTLKVEKIKENNKTTINISDLKANLIYTYYKGSRVSGSIHHDHKIIPFDVITSSDFKDYKEYYAKYKQVLTSIDDSIIVSNINE